jgi:spore coat polysaccharide biosynthesis protein SpsF
MSKVVAIIQARMGSTRLPGKVMMDIVGKPMLWHIINRVQRSQLLDEIVVATTTRKEDSVIAALAAECGTGVFLGSDWDVLDRYYRCAKKARTGTVVRITADDPFKDPAVTDLMVRTYLDHKGGVDYVSNTIRPTFPEGLDVEVFSYSALEDAWANAKDAFDREHVTAYLWRNPDRFRLLNVENELGDLSHMRWTVDTPEDLAFARAIYERLFDKKEIFLAADILQLLKESPDIAEINKSTKQRSWSDDLDRTKGRD